MKQDETPPSTLVATTSNERIKMTTSNCPEMHKTFIVNGYCPICHLTNTTTTLNGQWPSDTWFRRALARQLKAEAPCLELKASLVNCQNAGFMPKV